MSKEMMSPLFESKLTGLFCFLASVFYLIFAVLYRFEVDGYQPMPKQVFLDAYSRPIGDQSLLTEVSHSLYYRSEKEGQSAGDFGKEALLRLFSYSKDELVGDVMYRRFAEFFSDNMSDTVFFNVFSLLSHQKIVMAQDAIVTARVIGDLTYEGKATWDYVTTAGLDLQAATFKFSGQMMITVHAAETYPTMNKVEIVVQRALVQDKIRGYQLISMELK